MVSNINDNPSGPIKDTDEARKHIYAVMGVIKCSKDGLLLYASLVSQGDEPKAWTFDKYTDDQLRDLSRRLNLPKRLSAYHEGSWMASQTGDFGKLVKADDALLEIERDVKNALRNLDNSKLHIYDGKAVPYNDQGDQ